MRCAPLLRRTLERSRTEATASGRCRSDGDDPGRARHVSELRQTSSSSAAPAAAARTSSATCSTTTRAFDGVPIECRFHCNPKGLADVVGGRATPEEFLRKLRSYWWHRVRIGDAPYVAGAASGGRSARGEAGRVRGLHQIVAADALRGRGRRASRRAATADLARGLAQPLLRPPAAAADRGRQAGAGRDELLHDRGRARAGADLPRGAVRARRCATGATRAPRRSPAREAPPPDRRRLGDRLLGRPAAPGRGGRARARTLPDRVRLHVISLDELSGATARAPTPSCSTSSGVARRARDARVLRRAR